VKSVRLTTMFVFCPSMMIMMVRRTHFGRVVLCPGFPGGKADPTADGGWQSAVGSPPH